MWFLNQMHHTFNTHLNIHQIVSSMTTIACSSFFHTTFQKTHSSLIFPISFLSYFFFTIWWEGRNSRVLLRRPFSFPQSCPGNNVTVQHWHTAVWVRWAFSTLLNHFLILSNQTVICKQCWPILDSQKMRKNRNIACNFKENFSAHEEITF